MIRPKEEEREKFEDGVDYISEYISLQNTNQNILQSIILYPFLCLCGYELNENKRFCDKNNRWTISENEDKNKRSFIKLTCHTNQNIQLETKIKLHEDEEIN